MSQRSRRSRPPSLAGAWGRGCPAGAEARATWVRREGVWARWRSHAQLEPRGAPGRPAREQSAWPPRRSSAAKPPPRTYPGAGTRGPGRRPPAKRLRRWQRGAGSRLQPGSAPGARLGGPVWVRPRQPGQQGGAPAPPGSPRGCGAARPATAGGAPAWGAACGGRETGRAGPKPARSPGPGLGKRTPQELLLPRVSAPGLERGPLHCCFQPRGPA